MEHIVQQLEKAEVGKVRTNEPLSKHTTIKIGGPADIFIEPSGIEELQKTMAIIQEANLPWRVIGRGSNLLAPDAGIRGAVIKIDRGIRDMKVEDNELRIGAGYPMVPLSTIMSKKGFAGFEFSGGIPGSVGGAVYMNAGAHGTETGDILKKARILYSDGSLKWLTNEELKFSYRTSDLQFHEGIVVEAVFNLAQGDPTEILNDMQSYKDYRHKTQPYDKPCCGSVFRNPLPNHAGKLIQDAGLKGYKLGGAQVSELHGNFIINAGGATEQNVRDLIDFIKQTIQERNGIQLKTEVEFITKLGD